MTSPDQRNNVLGIQEFSKSIRIFEMLTADEGGETLTGEGG